MLRQLYPVRARLLWEPAIEILFITQRQSEWSGENRDDQHLFLTHLRCSCYTPFSPASVILFLVTIGNSIPHGHHFPHFLLLYHHHDHQCFCHHRYPSRCQDNFNNYLNYTSSLPLRRLVMLVISTTSFNDANLEADADIIQYSLIFIDDMISGLVLGEDMISGLVPNANSISPPTTTLQVKPVWKCQCTSSKPAFQKHFKKLEFMRIYPTNFQKHF